MEPVSQTTAPGSAPGSDRLLRLTVGAVLALGAFFPLARVALDPANVLPGTGRGDVYKRTWAYWHSWAQALNGDWITTSYLNAPKGGTFLDIMALPAAIMGPVTAAGGPVLSANLWVLFSLVAVGWVTYAFCRQLGTPTPGALLAGVLMQSSPYLMGYALTSGVHERLPIWIFPLALMALFKLRAGAGWRWPLLLVPTSLLAISQCPTYGLFLALLLFVTLPVVLKNFPRQDFILRLSRIMGACLAMALVVGAIALLYGWLVQQPDFLVGIQKDRLEPTMDIKAPETHDSNKATLAKLLNPVEVRATRPQAIDDELYKLIYLGWIPLLAVFVGIFLARRRGQPHVAALSGLALILILLSLGPEISALGYSAPNLPHHLVSLLIPYYGRIPSGWQLTGVALVLAAPALGWAVAAFKPGKPRLVAALVLGALALGERALVLPVPMVLAQAPARVPAIYDAAVGEGPLVDIPRLIPGQYLTHGAIFLAQTRHRHPIPLAVNLGRGTNDYFRPSAQGQAADWAQAMACLAVSGMRWVMIHEDWFPDAAAGRFCTTEIAAALGPPVKRAGPKVLFDLQSVRKMPRLEPDLCPHGWDPKEYKSPTQMLIPKG